MRSPKRRRRPVRAVVPPPEGTDLGEIAKGVRYVGSPEHKDTPSFAGPPRPRHATASICDPSLAQSQATLTRWLRRAVRAGCTGGYWEGGFPRYVWYRQGDTVYEGRLVNKGLREYKGYPLRREEWPKGLEQCDE